MNARIGAQVVFRLDNQTLATVDRLARETRLDRSKMLRLLVALGVDAYSRAQRGPRSDEQGAPAHRERPSVNPFRHNETQED